MIHRAEQLQRLRWGAIGSVAMSLIGFAIDHQLGAVDAIALGAVATGMQMLAARIMWRTGVAPTVDHLAVYGVGVGLRFLGVAVMAALLYQFPREFLLVPSAVGYLGTVLPLLYLETRLGR